MIPMKHKGTCTLKTLINNSDIPPSSTICVHNRLKNKVVGVVFAYP